MWRYGAFFLVLCSGCAGTFHERYEDCLLQDSFLGDIVRLIPCRHEVSNNSKYYSEEIPGTTGPNGVVVAGSTDGPVIAPQPVLTVPQQQPISTSQPVILPPLQPTSKSQVNQSNIIPASYTSAQALPPLPPAQSAGPQLIPVR